MAVTFAGAGEPLSVTISPPELFHGGYTVTFLSDTLYAIVASAVGSVSYLWTIEIGDLEHGATISAPGGTGVTASFVDVFIGDTAAISVRCTVTNGANTAFADAIISYTRFG